MSTIVHMGQLLIVSFFIAVRSQKRLDYIKYINLHYRKSVHTLNVSTYTIENRYTH